MHTCKICGETFETVMGLGGHSKQHSKGPKEIAYDLNPKLCGNCGKPLLWKVIRKNREAAFCGRKCAAIKQHQKDDK